MTAAGLPDSMPKAPPGWLAYAIGDIHGRLDLLDRMLALIDVDRLSRVAEKVVIIVLGDVIDRGPDSRGVVERLMQLSHGPSRLICLMGNHEEVLLRLINGERGLLQDWLLFGGSECLRSYGADPRRIAAMPEKLALKAIRRAIPAGHAHFLSTFIDTLSFGDYLFVHAGVRPGVPIAEQKQLDLRWIRQDFLEFDGDLGAVVVHGHTITPRIDERPNRIGIDTGAYRSGRLTALCLQEDRRWYLSTLD